MIFPELCERLAARGVPVAVSDQRYPGVGAGSGDDWVLWARDGHFDVGGAERGEFLVTRTFDTEAEACDYLFEDLTAKSVPVASSPEDNERSRQINREVDAKARELLARRFAE